MGIVLGVLVDVGADVAAEAAVEAAAEAAAEAASEAAAEAASEAAAEAAAEGATETAGEAAAEAAAEGASDTAVDAAVDAEAKAGTSQIVRQVFYATIVTGLISSLIEGTNKVVSAMEGGAEVKAVLKAINEALGMARGNMKTWNVQISQAVKAGKLSEMEKVDGMQLTLANLFSATMNAKIAKFLAQVKPAMVKVNAAASVKKPDLDRIKKNTKAAQAVFVMAANEFLATLKKWDQKEDAIKSEAGVNFQVADYSRVIKDVEKITISLAAS